MIFSQKYFLNENHIWPTLFEKMIFVSKNNCYWNCWLGPSKRPKQQIELHPTSWQLPLINYPDPKYRPLSCRKSVEIWWLVENDCHHWHRVLEWKCLTIDSSLFVSFRHNTWKINPRNIFVHFLNYSSK